MPEDIKNYVITLIIGIVTGSFTSLLPIWWSNKNKAKNIKLSLVKEINFLHMRYEETIRCHLLNKSETYVPFFHRAEQNYFSIFDASAHEISILDSKSIDLIISFYVNARGLLDTARVHSEFSGEYFSLSSSTDLTVDELNRLSNLRDRLIQTTTSLRVECESLDSLYRNIVKSL